MTISPVTSWTAMRKPGTMNATLRAAPYALRTASSCCPGFPGRGKKLGQGDPGAVAAHSTVLQVARVAAGAEMLRSEVQDPLAQGLGGEPDGVAYAQ
jgi:hypothetical protein